jgi:hypothetical protein
MIDAVAGWFVAPLSFPVVRQLLCRQVAQPGRQMRITIEYCTM